MTRAAIPSSYIRPHDGAEGRTYNVRCYDPRSRQCVTVGTFSSKKAAEAAFRAGDARLKRGDDPRGAAREVDPSRDAPRRSAPLPRVPPPRPARGDERRASPRARASAPPHPRAKKRSRPSSAAPSPRRRARTSSSPSSPAAGITPSPAHRAAPSAPPPPRRASSLPPARDGAPRSPASPSPMMRALALAAARAAEALSGGGAAAASPETATKRVDRIESRDAAPTERTVTPEARSEPAAEPPRSISSPRMWRRFAGAAEAVFSAVVGSPSDEKDEKVRGGDGDEDDEDVGEGKESRERVRVRVRVREPSVRAASGASPGQKSLTPGTAARLDAFARRAARSRRGASEGAGGGGEMAHEGALSSTRALVPFDALREALARYGLRLSVAVTLEKEAGTGAGGRETKGTGER